MPGSYLPWQTAQRCQPLATNQTNLSLEDIREGGSVCRSFFCEDLESRGVNMLC